MKRVYIVHGWGGYPEEGWFPWLKKELEKRNYEVEVPKMPSPDTPKINSWVNYLSKVVGKPNKDHYFVGHSIGCQAILRYLGTINEKIGGMILVAPWITLDENTIKEEGEESVKIAKPCIETPIDFEKIRTATNNFTAIFSDNDPFVPLENSEIFKSKLNAKIIMEKNKGHFSGSDNVKKLPVVLKELLKF